MEKINCWRGLTDEAVEEWFLNHLPESKICFNELLEVIVHFAEKNQMDRAEACAELLVETLKKNGAEDELLILLERRAGWQLDSDAYGSSCFKTLNEFSQGRKLMQIFLEASGLASGVQPQEALRRVRVLRKLQPGKCCYEKTWGLGKVSEIDEFDRKLVIDFERKALHRLALNYAAESVQPLDDNHFLALKLREPAKFNQWVKDNPAETLKAVLRQFGEMNLAQLRAFMTGLVIPEKAWSSFWSSARAKLFNDPFVQMPVRHNEPIRLLAEKKEFDERWRNDFLALRDIERILAQIQSLFSVSDPPNLKSDLRQAVKDRLQFVLQETGAERQRVIIQALLFADIANIGPEMPFDITGYGRPEIILTALNSIPARMIKPFLTYLERNSLPITDTLMQILPRLLSSALNEVIIHCRQNGKEEQLYEKIRVLLQEDVLSAGMILWMGRNLRLICEKKVCRPEDFAQKAFEILQRSAASGKRKDTVKMLRNIFTDKELLKEMLQPMNDNQRFDFTERFNSLAGLTVGDKAAVAAKITLLFPALAGAFGATAVSVAGPKLTSYRSYREKQAQLEKIIKEEIPRNSLEIGVARSYGDLSENYEYKAAREMQGLLMRRKADLEQILSVVKGTDFAGFPHEVAGPGTSVELKIPDGRKLFFHVLGEYDADENLGIISCRSRLAEALRGKRAGDCVEIPGENSPLSCVIEAIRELSPEITEWINGGVL